MRIAIGSDHAGFNLKSEIIRYLRDLGNEVQDLGTYSLESVDYPIYAKKVALSVKNGDSERGIVVCGTGIGISMAANRYEGIRAALCLYPEMAIMSRKHNDANVLALGGRLIAPDLAFSIVSAFLNTDFEGGKHERRVRQIDELLADD